jgi:hypothetical protein
MLLIPYSANDDCFLKDRIISEDLISSIKNMNPSQPHLMQEETAKRPEVRAVAETARGDRDKLSLRT